MAKSQALENIEKSCGARLRSKKIGFLRVAPQIGPNSLQSLEKSDAEQARSMRSNCGGENPPYPPVCSSATHGVACCGEHRQEDDMSADRHNDGMSIRDGCLIFTGRESAENMTFGPGQWQAALVASGIDGHAVAVEQWCGEVVR